MCLGQFLCKKKQHRNRALSWVLAVLFLEYKGSQENTVIIGQWLGKWWSSCSSLFITVYSSNFVHEFFLLQDCREIVVIFTCWSSRRKKKQTNIVQCVSNIQTPLWTSRTIWCQMRSCLWFSFAAPKCFPPGADRLNQSWMSLSVRGSIACNFKSNNCVIMWTLTTMLLSSRTSFVNTNLFLNYRGRNNSGNRRYALGKQSAPLHMWIPNPSGWLSLLNKKTWKESFICMQFIQYGSLPLHQ